MILEAGLPNRVAVDSSVIVPAFTRTHACYRVCIDLMTFLVRHRTLVIPSATLAECLILGDELLADGLPGVEVIGFDALGAMRMAKAIGGKAGLRAAGYPKQVVKFDAMIVGTCIAHSVTLLLSRDGNQRKIATRVGLLARDPADFWAEPEPESAPPPPPQVPLNFAGSE
jgi:hypothetical protein